MEDTRQESAEETKQEAESVEKHKMASREASQKTMVMEATAYTYFVASITIVFTYTGNKTATGTWPKIGVAAVDPKVIPLGTMLYVEGYGYARAEDTGGLIKGDRIDLFFETEQECIEWGRKNVKVRIVE